jgi:mRNA-degrading endonuclease RelE of RelBE toxin-antitoxin system
MKAPRILLVPAKGYEKQLKDAIRRSILTNGLEEFVRVEYEPHESISSGESLCDAKPEIQRIVLAFAKGVTISTRMKILTDLLAAKAAFTMELSEAGACIAELIEEAALNEEVIMQGTASVFQVAPYRRMTLSQTAKSVFNAMPLEHRRSIKIVINPLESFSKPNEAIHMKKLALDNLYMTKAGDLRIIFRVDDDTIEIEDIFHKNRLSKFKRGG